MAEIKQLEHNEFRSCKKQFPLILVCDDIKTPENVGMVFRLAEAFGVEEVILCGTTPTPPNTKIRKTARSCDKSVKWSYSESILFTLDTLIEKNYSTVALEITNNSMSLPKCNFSSYSRIALILGSEAFGISEIALKKCHTSVDIPMYGNNSSLNVATATAIALYEITNQLP